MPFRRCKACVVGRAVVPIAYWEIGPYDEEKIRRALRARHISPLLAMRNTENGSGLGRWRWVIERTFALICWNFLQVTSRDPRLPNRQATIGEIEARFFSWDFRFARENEAARRRTLRVIHAQVREAPLIRPQRKSLLGVPRRTAM